MGPRAKGARAVGSKRARGQEAASGKLELHGMSKYVVSSYEPLLLDGECVLRVLRGYVTLLGRALSAESGPVIVSGDVELGTPLAVELDPGGGGLPLAAVREAEVAVEIPRGRRLGLWPSVVWGRTPGERDEGGSGGEGEAGGGNRGGGGAGPAPVPPPPLPPIWLSALDELRESVRDSERAPLVAILGPKKTGKSTLSRWVTNTLLNDSGVVHYLDLDPGQPEMGLPGCIGLWEVRGALTGSPRQHLGRPSHRSVRLAFVGDVSPGSDPAEFVRLAEWVARGRTEGSVLRGRARLAGRPLAGGARPDADLGGDPPGLPAARGRREWDPPPPHQLEATALSPPPPCVINFHGWIKGFGLESTAAVLRLLPVTHCVQLAFGQPAKDLPPPPFWSDPLAVSPALARAAGVAGGGGGAWAAGSGAGGDALPPSSRPARPDFSWRPPSSALPGIRDGTVSWLIPALPLFTPPEGSVGAARSAVELRNLQWSSWVRTCASEADERWRAEGTGLEGGRERAEDAGRGGRRSGPGPRAGEPDSPGPEEDKLDRLADAEPEAPATSAEDSSPPSAPPRPLSPSGGEDPADLLALTPPYSVPLEDLTVRVTHGQVRAGHLQHALNGALVGLCHDASPPEPSSVDLDDGDGPDDDLALGDGIHTGLDGSGDDYGGGDGGPACSPPPANPRGSLPLPAHPHALGCLGIGLVRSIDPQSRLLHVITDVAPSLLPLVDTLALGRLELPPTLLAGARFRSPYLSVGGVGTDGTAAGIARSRGNLQRLGGRGTAP